MAIHSNKRRKSRERAHLANAGEFNRQYLTCHISAILYTDRGDRRKWQSLHRAHLAIFADRGDRRIKSPSVSLALGRVRLTVFRNVNDRLYTSGSK